MARQCVDCIEMRHCRLTKPLCPRRIVGFFSVENHRHTATIPFSYGAMRDGRVRVAARMSASGSVSPPLMLGSCPASKELASGSLIAKTPVLFRASDQLSVFCGAGMRERADISNRSVLLAAGDGINLNCLRSGGRVPDRPGAARPCFQTMRVLRRRPLAI